MATMMQGITGKKYARTKILQENKLYIEKKSYDRVHLGHLKNSLGTFEKEKKKKRKVTAFFSKKFLRYSFFAYKQGCMKHLKAATVFIWDI